MPYLSFLFLFLHILISFLCSLSLFSLFSISSFLLFIYLSFYPFFNLLRVFTVCLPVRMFTCLSLCYSLCPSIPLCVCLPACHSYKKKKLEERKFPKYALYTANKTLHFPLHLNFLPYDFCPFKSHSFILSSISCLFHLPLLSPRNPNSRIPLEPSSKTLEVNKAEEAVQRGQGERTGSRRDEGLRNKEGWERKEGEKERGGTEE